ncbi:MAG: TlpA family protein disulfide reductase [Bacteroidetes bacterium]|nr:TlpA family protein disulfide reductase [Bacteroidota bacterium]
MRSATVSGSEINTRYEQLKTDINALKTQSNTLSGQYNQLRSNPEAQAKVVAQMEVVDKAKMDLLNSVREENEWLGNVVALNTYMFYPVSPEGYENEIGYFAEQFFRFVDWTDPSLAYNPWVYESWKSYVETLSRIGILPDNHKKFIQASLDQIPTEMRAHRLALGGAIASLEKTSHPNFGHFAQQYIDAYQKEYPGLCAELSQKIKRVSSLVVGGEAPDFEMETPEGEVLNLHSLRGKVVLVDFWASWCGPCRRENPNVVKAYEKYKEEGFEVLGVSLDRDRNKWLKAIEADGLAWQHVSDLKGWQNEAAGIYGVRSIPATVLLDAEGRIIARNLRGPALENKLKEIFGK